MLASLATLRRRWLSMARSAAEYCGLVSATRTVDAGSRTSIGLNLLHVNTNQSFIRRELLFQEGDCFDPFLLTESYRLLDQYGFMMVEDIESYDDGAGGHRINVATRDEWSTKIDIGPAYDDALYIERLQVTEENFLGSGVFAEFTH